MKNGGTGDDSSVGFDNTWTVKSYKKKDSQGEYLPSRHARTVVTKGDQGSRASGNYSKKASGGGGHATYIFSLYTGS